MKSSSLKLLENIPKLLFIMVFLICHFDTRDLSNQSKTQFGLDSFSSRDGGVILIWPALFSDFNLVCRPSLGHFSTHNNYWDHHQLFYGNSLVLLSFHFCLRQQPCISKQIELSLREELLLTLLWKCSYICTGGLSSPSGWKSYSIFRSTKPKCIKALQRLFDFSTLQQSGGGIGLNMRQYMWMASPWMHTVLTTVKDSKRYLFGKFESICTCFESFWVFCF